jgi:site-specific recombinase XerD
MDVERMTLTFGQARTAYANEVSSNSVHTRNAYLRSIDLCINFLNDREFENQLPIQSGLATTADELALEMLQTGDELILWYFALWMQAPGQTGEKRPYSFSTIELRLAGSQRWFEFMATRKWLPATFSLDNAVSQLKTNFVTQRSERKVEKNKRVDNDLQPLLDYYSHQAAPKYIQMSEDRLHRWELTTLRNHALVQMLAETGGQISAILSLNLDIFLVRQSPMGIQVKGKGGHSYSILLANSLPAIYSYLSRREIDPEKASVTPLFVSHDARYEAQRMSRIIAWRIIQRAAHGTGLPEVSPHDLRHWRAQQLIQAGHSLEEVRELLGHRSVHTIRAYYGHISEQEGRS